jgi:hypothetical protein
MEGYSLPLESDIVKERFLLRGNVLPVLFGAGQHMVTASTSATDDQKVLSPFLEAFKSMGVT